MSTATLKSLFAYKAWADGELFALLAALPPDHADTLHACLRTLHHVFIVDRIFCGHLVGEPGSFASTRSTHKTPALAALRREVLATDAWYVRYVATLPASAHAEILEFAFAAGDRGRMSREDILLHVLTQGVYHRGKVGQLLKSDALAPPRDLYTRFLHLREPVQKES